MIFNGSERLVNLIEIKFLLGTYLSEEAYTNYNPEYEESIELIVTLSNIKTLKSVVIIFDHYFNEYFCDWTDSPNMDKITTYVKNLKVLRIKKKLSVINPCLPIELY